MGNFIVLNQFLVIGSMIVVSGWLLFLLYFILKSAGSLLEKSIWLCLIITAVVVGMTL